MCHVSAHVYFYFYFLKKNLINFYKNKIKIATCQSDIVSHGRDNVMWQWQCHVSLLDVKTLNVVLVFIILSQFGPNFFKTKSISSLYQI